MGRPHPKSLSHWERDFEVLFRHEGMFSRKLDELVSANERGHYPKQEASQRRTEQLTERLREMGISAIALYEVNITFHSWRGQNRYKTS